MELWVTEYQTPPWVLAAVTQTLRARRTRFQHLAVVETEQFGDAAVGRNGSDYRTG